MNGERVKGLITRMSMSRVIIRVPEAGNQRLLIPLKSISDAGNRFSVPEDVEARGFFPQLSGSQVRGPKEEPFSIPILVPQAVLDRVQASHPV